jgi:hypothetical protein
MKMVAFIVAALAALLVVFVPREAMAHGMRAAYLEIQSDGDTERALVRFRLTIPTKDVTPDLPGCKLAPASAPMETDSGDVTSFVATCPTPLRGRAVGVSGLGPTITEAVVHATLDDGSIHTAVLSEREPSTVIPERSTFVSVAREFIAHGFRHVLSGLDHVLFLLLLVFTLKRARPVLVAEAAFTLSHTLSFAATALGIVRVSTAPAEACIALSLVLVALDLGRANEKTPSTVHAAGLAFAFGVVHGLGFAGGLREIGLPEDHVASALVGFGFGIELGQLLLCAVGLVFVRFVLRFRRARHVFVTAAYGSGGLASAWLFERLSVCFAN